jgi:hypothetical protein
MRFDALLLVDCWDENWIRKQNGLHIRQFYGRLIDYVDMFSFVNVLFASGYENTHPWFENHYPNHRYVRNIRDVKEVLHMNSSVLIGGAAWNYCLHYAPVSIQTLSDSGYHLYSHPEIVDTGMYDNTRVTHDDFKRDNVPWRKVYDFYYLQAGNIQNNTNTKGKPPTDSL